MNRKYRIAAQRRAAHHRAQRRAVLRDPELLGLLRAAAAIARPRPEPDPSGRRMLRSAHRGAQAPLRTTEPTPGSGCRAAEPMAAQPHAVRR
ncbi:hypothetical protein DN069_04655 [Streptacidiphilus pinicola]|uniref:Uncharacterized protein n=1 Tax=Streptacidiphilus pinicola TaxID=2219663 RepID=A0A2X0JGP1_9ACTN|nr:hypothetical protein DN069_04655 [Streptacidiphilus pinicola]